MSDPGLMYRVGALLRALPRHAAVVVASMAAALLAARAPAQSTDLIISEYVEGSSNNRAIEIYNGTLGSVNFTAGGYRLAIYRNGAASPSSIISLNGTLPSNGCWVVTSSSASGALLARANQTASNSQFSFNGDDSIVLIKGATNAVVDAFGQTGFDPGSAWTAGGVTTADVTLVRKPSVCGGDIIANNAFNPSIEWTQFPIDTYTNLGTHSANCIDLCPNDPNKTQPGLCGCGVPDTDNDGDGTPNCFDGCPNDPGKIEPGDCGCGVPDADSDGDFLPDCVDGCPNDPFKFAPGLCGCGVPDIDSDGDGTANCLDGCPNDPGKTQPGLCGCGVPDTDTDADGTPDCNDGCPNDPSRTTAETWYLDADGDGFGDPNATLLACKQPSGYVATAGDLCPADPLKQAPGQCGCGVPDTDSDGDGTADCNESKPQLRLWADNPAVRAGGTLVVTVAMTDLDDAAVGAQFALHFDETRLAFATAEPLSTGPMPREIYESADAVAGTLVYAQGVNDGAAGTSAAADLAELRFTALEDLAGLDGCDITQLVRFAAVPPVSTRVANANGQPIPVLLFDLGPVDVDVTAPVLSGVPANISVPATSSSGAFVAQPSVTASDNCDPEVSVTLSIVFPSSSTSSFWPADGIFPIGTTSVSWSASDDAGNTTTAARTITVVNAAPVVTITSPAPNSQFFLSTAITFSGTAIDNEQGNLTSILIWTSNLQGPIGSGGSFTRSDLVIGTHTITASATDITGAVGSASIQVIVLDPGAFLPAAPTNPNATVSGSVV
ncbi:MAG: lamin tail domain-containing protein, partial [Phycisphaerales bacterium]